METAVFVQRLGELLDRGFDGLEGFHMVGGVFKGTSQ
jgi:hypothetical protein